MSIVVDPVAFKREQAELFGATHTASNLEEAALSVMDLTWGALADKAIITTGVAEGDMIAPVMAMVSKGGRCVVTAVAPLANMDVQLSLFELTLQQKQLVGQHLRQREPASRHPAAAPALHGRQAQARRARHPHLPVVRRRTRATRTCATARTSAACWCTEPLTPRSPGRLRGHGPAIAPTFGEYIGVMALKDGEAASVGEDTEELVEDELLVEEISIDGMCGVY